MSNFALLAQGFVTAISPMNLFACLIGGIIGILVGAMPGIGAVAGCSLLLPMTYKMNPTTGKHDDTGGRIHLVGHRQKQ